MDTSKQTTLITFSKKVKSPYTLQYLEFQQRLKGNKKTKQKLPTLSSNSRKSGDAPPSENYLHLAHELINTRERIWFGDNKENLFPTIDSGEEVMNSIKEKISRMKNRSQQQHLHPRALQQSEQLTKPLLPTQVSAKSANPHVKTSEPTIRHPEQPANQPNIRSRVHSEALRPPSSGKQSSAVTFLQYKKSKRELSIRLRQVNQR